MVWFKLYYNRERVGYIGLGVSAGKHVSTTHSVQETNKYDDVTNLRMTWGYMGIHVDTCGCFLEMLM